ncbi:hypothetical protein ACOMHN_059734 [Nucella lapillus]
MLLSRRRSDRDPVSANEGFVGLGQDGGRSEPIGAGLTGSAQRVTCLVLLTLSKATSSHRDHGCESQRQAVDAWSL